MAEPHQGHTDAGPEMLGVSGNREQGLSGRLEQETVDHRLVVIREFADRPGQGEDQVIVIHGQEVCLACFQPTPGRTGLTLWTMPVTTSNGEHPITCLMGSAS